MSSRIGPNLETELFASERKELETVLESGLFAVSSNAAKLLRFVCEHHFSNASDPITEYDVAIHALDRRADFDPQRDSIVRVEAHRVRKRLEEYYEKDGAGHAVKILLSRGRYGLTFVHTEPAGAQPVAAESRTRRSLVRAQMGAAGGRNCRRGTRRCAARRFDSPPADRDRAQTAAAVSGDTVRILADRPSGDYVDRFGRCWSADQFFTGGNSANIRLWFSETRSTSARLEYHPVFRSNTPGSRGC